MFNIENNKAPIYLRKPDCTWNEFHDYFIRNSFDIDLSLTRIKLKNITFLFHNLTLMFNIKSIYLGIVINLFAFLFLPSTHTWPAKRHY